MTGQSRRASWIWASLVSTGFILAGQAAQAQETPQDKDRVRDRAKENRTTLDITWRPAYRLTNIYYENENKSSIPALFNGPDNGVGVPRWEPLRFEALGDFAITDHMSIFGRFIGGRTHLRLFDGQAVSDGFDMWIDAGVAYSLPLGWFSRFRAYAAVRVYNWFFNDTQVPHHGNLGLAIGIQPRWGNFDLTLEVTTAALGIFTDDRLGKQQDSSQLRIRGEYALHFTDMFAIKPGLEIFHSKANFSNTTFIPGRTAWFWDDVQVALLLGLSKSF